MQFADFAALGYRNDLVCVIPPGAKLHPESKINPAECGKTPGRPSGDGWGGYDWRRTVPTEGQLQFWDSHGANVGLQCRNFPAVDIDVEDPALAEAIALEAILTLGVAPCRSRGNSAKRLMLYSTATPMGKAKLVFQRDGVRAAVEVLGEGQQFVASGTHPSGAAYSWDREPDPLDLVRTDAADLGAFFDALEALLRDEGCEVLSRTDRAAHALGGAPRAAEALLGDVASIVGQMPNDGGWDELQDMAYACKAAMGEDGFHVLLEWAYRWTGGECDEQTVKDLWARCVPPFRIGAQWIRDRAQALGVNTAPDEFDGVPAPPAPPRAVVDAQKWSDLAIAREVARRAEEAGEPFLYVPELDHFLLWNGERWDADAEDRIGRLIADTCSEVAAQVRMQDETKGGTTLARAICGARTISSVTKLLRSSAAGQLRKLEVFDANDWELNTPGGVVDLRTGTLQPHAHQQLCRAMAEATPARAPHPRWDAFLHDVTGGQDDYKRYLQKLAGYALTGSTREQMLAFLYGPGGNGKSVFTNVLSAVLGTYARTSGMDVFLASRGERHKTEVARLAGARLVTATETEDGRKWDKARVSDLTGGTPIAARFIGKDFFEFTPKFTLLLSGNHRPETSTVDDALKRRLHILPFTFKPARVNPDLQVQLAEEHDAILQWMVDGCLMWQREELRMPEVGNAETQDYFESEDTFGSWVRERTVTDELEAFTHSRDLFADWQHYCQGAGENPGTLKRFSQKVKQRGRELHQTIVASRNNSGNGFRGIRLRRLDETDVGREFAEQTDNVIPIRK